MWSFCNIFISVVVHHICKHFEIEMFVNVCWVFDNVVVAHIAGLETICVNKG